MCWLDRDGFYISYPLIFYDEFEDVAPMMPVALIPSPPYGAKIFLGWAPVMPLAMILSGLDIIGDDPLQTPSQFCTSLYTSLDRTFTVNTGALLKLQCK